MRRLDDSQADATPLHWLPMFREAIERLGPGINDLLRSVIEPATSDEVAVSWMTQVPAVSELASILGGRGHDSGEIGRWVASIARAATTGALRRPPDLREDVLEIERAILAQPISLALDRIASNVLSWGAIRELAHSRLAAAAGGNSEEPSAQAILEDAFEQTRSVFARKDRSPWLASDAVRLVAMEGLTQELLLGYVDLEAFVGENTQDELPLCAADVQARGDGVWIVLEMPTVHSFPAIALVWLVDIAVRLLGFGVVLLDHRFELVSGDLEVAPGEFVEMPEYYLRCENGRASGVYSGMREGVVAVAAELLVVRSVVYDGRLRLVIYAAIDLTTAERVVEFVRAIAKLAPAPGGSVDASATAPYRVQVNSHARLIWDMWGPFVDLPHYASLSFSELGLDQLEASEEGVGQAEGLDSWVIEALAKQRASAVAKVSSLLVGDRTASQRGWSDEGVLSSLDDVALAVLVDNLSVLRPTFDVLRSSEPVPAAFGLR